MVWARLSRSEERDAMRLSRWILLLAVIISVVACTKGDECDTCTQDADCKSGFVCVSFSDGSKRCGSGIGSTTCRVP